MTYPDLIDKGEVQMNEQVKEYIGKYPSNIIEMFSGLRQLIYDSIAFEPNEALWAKLPSYYVGESFVRLIPFKDHINIEATAIAEHKKISRDIRLLPKECCRYIPIKAYRKRF